MYSEASIKLFLRSCILFPIMDTPPSSQDQSIEVTIVFFSTLKKITGQTQISISIPRNQTILSILEKIHTMHFLPHNARLLSADNKSLEVGHICLVDDVDLQLIGGGPKHKLKKPCTITLISSLHGG